MSTPDPYAVSVNILQETEGLFRVSLESGIGRLGPNEWYEHQSRAKAAGLAASWLEQWARE